MTPSNITKLSFSDWARIQDELIKNYAPLGTAMGKILVSNPRQFGKTLAVDTLTKVERREDVGQVIDTEEPRERTGLPWTKMEMRNLYRSYLVGWTIDNLARKHKRTKVAIECKLQSFGLANFGHNIRRSEIEIAYSKELQSIYEFEYNNFFFNNKQQGDTNMNKNSLGLDNAKVDAMGNIIPKKQVPFMENTILLKGMDIRYFNEQAFIDTLKVEEASIAALKQLKNKPIFVKNKIKEHKENIQKLLAYLDDKEIEKKGETKE